MTYRSPDEAEFHIVQAELNQQIELISDLSGEPRKSAIRQAEHSLEEANGLLESMRLEKSQIPSAARSRVNQRFRNFESDIDAAKRRLKNASSDRAALLGSRYTDDPDDQLEQRQQLLSGTDRLERSVAHPVSERERARSSRV